MRLVSSDWVDGSLEGSEGSRKQLEGAGEESQVEGIVEVVDEECFGGEIFEIFSEVLVAGASSQSACVLSEEVLEGVVGSVDDPEDPPVRVLDGGVTEELIADAVELFEEGLPGLVHVALTVREAVAQQGAIALEALLDGVGCNSLDG